MLQDRKIAVFIDVDNCPLQFVNYENALNEISKMGEIVCAKIYGVNERKNKEIVEHATNCGYDTLLGMRVKKRGAKVYDNRITADVLESVFTMPNIDAVAIVAAPSDMVYLFRMLHKYDIAVIAYDNGDEFTSNLIDEKLDLGIVELLPPPKKAPAKPRAKVAPAPVEEQPTTLVGQANDLLNKVNEIREEKAAEQHEETAQAVASQATPTETVAEPVKAVEPEQPQVVVAEPVSSVDQEVANDADFVKRLEKSYDSSSDESDAAAFLEKLNKIFNED